MDELSNVFQLFLRFGLVQSTSADEEAKKKARLARFAPASKPDSVEEDKRKARAIRFVPLQRCYPFAMACDWLIKKLSVLAKWRHDMSFWILFDIVQCYITGFRKINLLP